MSAGAVGDVLGYPNLPDEFHGASHRSTLLHSRASARTCYLFAGRAWRGLGALVASEISG